jgi:hypothetical protein
MHLRSPYSISGGSRTQSPQKIISFYLFSFHDYNSFYMNKCPPFEIKPKTELFLFFYKLLPKIYLSLLLSRLQNITKQSWCPHYKIPLVHTNIIIDNVFYKETILPKLDYIKYRKLISN